MKRPKACVAQPRLARGEVARRARGVRAPALLVVRRKGPKPVPRHRSGRHSHRVRLRQKGDAASETVVFGSKSHHRNLLRLRHAVCVVVAASSLSTTRGRRRAQGSRRRARARGAVFKATPGRSAGRCWSFFRSFQTSTQITVLRASKSASVGCASSMPRRRAAQVASRPQLARRRSCAVYSAARQTRWPARRPAPAKPTRRRSVGSRIRSRPTSQPVSRSGAAAAKLSSSRSASG